MMIKELGPAGKLIEKGWTQGKSCCDSEGKECDPKNAVAFCSIGAIVFERDSQYGPCYYKLFESIQRKYPNALAISSWNDDPNRTKEEVLEMFREAGI